MNRLQRSSLNILTSTVGFVVPMAINFITTPLLLRWLGEAGYGLQNLIGVITGYLSLMDVGLDIPIVKFLAEDHARKDYESQNRLLSTTLQIYVSIGFIGMLIIMLVADILTQQVFVLPVDLIEEGRIVFILSGVGFFTNVFTSWGRSVANGLQRYDLSNAVSIMTTLVSTSVGLGVVYAGYGVVGYVLCRIIGYLMSGVFYMLITVRLLHTFRIQWGFDRSTILRIRGYVGSGFIIRFSGLLTTNLDRTLIGSWISVAAVGVYSVPFLVVTALSYMIVNMIHFIFPMASELYTTNRVDELRVIYIQMTRFVAGIASFVFPLLFVLGDVLLKLWVGPNIAEQANTVFRLMLLAGYISTLTVTLINGTIVGMGYLKPFSWYIFLRAICISMGYVLLIRVFGINGAGMSLLVGNLAEIIFTILSLRRYIQLSLVVLLREAYLRPIILGLGMILLASAVNLFITSWVSLVLAVGLLGIFYVALAFLIGVFGETERRAMMILWHMANRFVSKSESLSNK